MSGGAVQVWPGMPVQEALIDDERVIGIRLTDQGVDKDGLPEASFMPGMDVHAALTVVGDGPVGVVGRQLDTEFGLPEGHYRVWARSDNSGGLGYRDGYGVSIDQTVAQAITLFARYGNGEVGDIPGKLFFYSGGVQFGAPHAFNPQDFWGIGLAHQDYEEGPSEKIAEVFYNLNLTTHLRSSFMLQYVEESATGEAYILPGARIQVVF